MQLSLQCLGDGVWSVWHWPPTVGDGSHAKQGLVRLKRCKSCVARVAPRVTRPCCPCGGPANYYLRCAWWLRQ